MLMINDTKHKALSNDWFPAKHTKRWVVLHFTAGDSLDGAETTLHTPDYVQVAYTIDKDGIAYKKFDPSGWAYSLGVRGYPKGWFDQQAIAIEIVNVGPLKLKGSDLCWWPPVVKNMMQFQKKYCTVADKARFVQQSFREYDYYAAFTAQQMQAAGELVKNLCDVFKIPKQNLGTQVGTDLRETLYKGNWNGIISHQNVRPDKTDIGPAWDWTAFMGVVRS